MKTVKTFAQQLSFSLMMAMTLGSAIVSCGSILDEEDVDCSVEYRVKFKYDYNMKYADAFSREVGTVTLYAFDDNGKLVYQKMEEGDVLGEDGYTMKVDLEPGDYHLITWAGLNNEASFSVPLVTAGNPRWTSCNARWTECTAVRKTERLSLTASFLRCGTAK